MEIIIVSFLNKYIVFNPLIKKRLKSFFRQFKKKVHLENYNVCPICNFEGRFLKLPEAFLDNYKIHGLAYPLSDFETLNIENYNCKNCGASDRDRLIALYFKKQFKSKDNFNVSLLDFAPSSSLFRFISEFNFKYRSADLYMENVDDKIDIQEMNIYEDATFDIFICSHILEHIDDDIKAMQELFRITKKNGIGVCLVPIPLSLNKSMEDKKYLSSEHLRWKYFGQDDHVRMYSKIDFIKRLSNVGFNVTPLGVEYFGKNTFEKHGISIKSVLYIVKK